MDDFSEMFAGYPLVFLIELSSGYDQCTLAEVSRDIMAFHTVTYTFAGAFFSGSRAFTKLVRKKGGMKK